MLGIILGHTELAMARVEPGEYLHADLAEIRMDEGAHFIQKPFSLKDLAAKLREALDE